MAELLLHIRQDADRTRVLVIGALDYRTAAQFREQVSHLITAEDTRRRVILDLRCCTHADDHVSSAWADVCAIARAAGKELELEEVPPLIDDCLRT